MTRPDTIDKIALQAYKQAWLRFRDAKYSAVPEHARPALKPFNDAVTNSITQAVQNFITWNGGHCNRIQSQGQFRAGRWVKGTTKKGTADLIAVVPSLAHGHALSVHIEIKNAATKDRLSDDQKTYGEQVQAAGAYYQTVTCFADYYQWWITTTQTKSE